MCLYANHIQNMVAQTQTCGIVTDREAEISEAQWLLWSRCQSAKMEVQDTRQHNNSVLPESNWTAWWVQSGSMIRHHYFHCILNSTLPSNFALLAYLPLARHSKTQQDIARKSGLHPCITAIIPQPALVTWFCFMMAIISSFNGSKPLWLQRNIHGEHPRLLKASPTFAAGSENMPWAPKDTSRDDEMILKSISNIQCHFNTNTMPGYSSSCLYRYIFILHTI